MNRKADIRNADKKADMSTDLQKVRNAGRPMRMKDETESQKEGQTAKKQKKLTGGKNENHLLIHERKKWICTQLDIQTDRQNKNE